ncbi:MAG: hypothetical protein KDC97_13805 [Confluentibacter sp.]|nr:hypothetical protein [Confluentibacter sp.]
MRHIYKIILTILLLIIVGCKPSESEIEMNHISNVIEKIEVDPSYKWMVVLPGLGCRGCIQEAEAFMKEHIENKDILFVLTKIESLKILQKKINVNVKEHDNIYIDGDLLFDMPTDNAIYPCIIKLNKGECASYWFQSPKNGDAFGKLKTYI